jgi:hypothetical protein
MFRLVLLGALAPWWLSFLLLFATKTPGRKGSQYYSLLNDSLSKLRPAY